MLNWVNDVKKFSNMVQRVVHFFHNSDTLMSKKKNNIVWKVKYAL